MFYNPTGGIWQRISALLLFAPALLRNTVKPVDLIVAYGFFRRGLEVLAVFKPFFLQAFLGVQGRTTQKQN
jgi:hypothetical protein